MSVMRQFIDQRSRKKRPKYVPRHINTNTVKFRHSHNWPAMITLGADPVWGSVVGQMYMEGVLTQAESDAASFYADVAGRFDRYHPVKDSSLTNTAKAQHYQVGMRAADTEIERYNRLGTIASYERRAKRMRKLWEKVQGEVGPAIRNRVVQLCILDERPPESAWHPIKEALTRISVRFLRGRALETKRRAPAGSERRLDDLKRLVLRAMDSIEDAFKVSGGTPAEFEIVAAQHSLGIRVYGIDRNGRQMSDCVMVKLRKGDLAEHVALLFLKQCEARKWKDHKKK